MRRCDSAAIVPNTSELLPDPDTPVNTVSRRLGISTLTSLRLFTRAPCTRMRSWLSASGAAGGAAALLAAAFLGIRWAGLIVSRSMIQGSCDPAIAPDATLGADRRGALLES